MKLLIILSLGLLSFGAMAQPDSKFDSPEYKEMQRQARVDKRIAQAKADAKKFESVTTENFTRDGAIFNTKLSIKGDGEKAEVAVVIRKTNGQSIKSGAGYVSHDYFKTEINANNLSEVNERISEGLELRSKSLLNYVGVGEERKAILSSQGNADSIDFIGAGVEVSFLKK